MSDPSHDLIDDYLEWPGVVYFQVGQFLQPAATALVSRLSLPDVDGAAMTAGAATFSRHLRRNSKPHGEVRIEETSSFVLIHDAGRGSDDRRSGAACHLDEYPQLDLMKRRDSVFTRDLGAGTAPCRLDLGIGIEERDLQPTGEGSPQGRLTDTHGPDQHDVSDVMTGLFLRSTHDATAP